MRLKKKIAIVVSDLSFYGGVPAVAKFLYEVINDSEDFQADYISLATSAADSDSRRIIKPNTWFNTPKVSERKFQGVVYRHIGANWTEFEPARYKPRSVLDKILAEYDLIQVVAGTPAWMLAAANVKVPLVLQVATLARFERESFLADAGLGRKLWGKLMIRLNNVAEKRAFARADRILVENKRLLNVLKTYPKVIFTPPGIDTDFFCLSEEEKENYVLSVGRFDDPRKNIRLLFEAFANFRRKTNAPLRLILAGQTPPKPSDIGFAENLGIGTDIEILTGVAVERLRELYQKAAFFVLSSDEEGLGLVLLEAAACGLPIVATKCGGAEEIVVEGETGFLVPTKNSLALAEKMADLWHNPKLRAEMGGKARTRTLTFFSKKNAGDKFLTVYRELLSEKRK